LTLLLESREDARGFTVDMCRVPTGQSVDVIRIDLEEPKATVAPGARGPYHFKQYERPLMRSRKT